MTERHDHRIVVNERWGPEVPELIEAWLPEPGAGEVRVRVAAAGVSGFDLLIRSISLPGNPKPPFTPGEDVAGVIDALGEGVTALEVGQRVAGLAARAHELLTRGRHAGKVVLTTSPGAPGSEGSSWT